MITISAFRWVPPFAQGQVRDLRVRWALEEAELSYRTRLLEQGDQDKPDYRALQPFGQVPIFEEDGQALFESGAIVLHIGERIEALLPRDAGARARATQWLVAALNSIEPHIMNVAAIELFYADQEWAKLTTVLRILPELIVNQHLAAYVGRCTSRPGFKRALDAQMGDFKQAA
jgi:glutathione S-transferase